MSESMGGYWKVRKNRLEGQADRQITHGFHILDKGKMKKRL